MTSGPVCARCRGTGADHLDRPCPSCRGAGCLDWPDDADDGGPDVDVEEPSWLRLI